MKHKFTREEGLKGYANGAKKATETEVRSRAKARGKTQQTGVRDCQQVRRQGRPDHHQVRSMRILKRGDAETHKQKRNDLRSLQAEREGSRAKGETRAKRTASQSKQRSKRGRASQKAQRSAYLQTMREDVHDRRLYEERRDKIRTEQRLLLPRMPRPGKSGERQKEPQEIQKRRQTAQVQALHQSQRARTTSRGRHHAREAHRQRRNNLRNLWVANFLRRRLSK